MDAKFTKRLGGVFGGALGCSHLLAIGMSLGAFVPRVLADPALAPAGRAPGERVAKQSLTLDGFEGPNGRLAVAIQVAGYRFAPRGAAENPLARLASVHEVQVLGEIALADMRLLALSASSRARSRAEAASGAWRGLDAAVAPLAGEPALRGMAPRVLARIATLPEGEERALLAEALLNFAPGLIQCMPALSHRLALFDRPGALGAGDEPGASAMRSSGGFPDSCYMWRTGGAAARTRDAG